MNEKLKVAETKPPITPQEVVSRVSISFTGETQKSPEELIARGEGSNKPSVCQKL